MNSIRQLNSNSTQKNKSLFTNNNNTLHLLPPYYVMYALNKVGNVNKEYTHFEKKTDSLH